MQIELIRVPASTLTEARISKLPTMSISQIAHLVARDWANVNYAAAPYLDAMSCLESANDSYGFDSGKSIITYFLCNAGAYRGELARAVKKELTKRVKYVD